MHKSISLIAEHRRLRIRCAELNTTIQDFILNPLNRKLSADGARIATALARGEQDR